jgi:hypothetical protein
MSVIPQTPRASGGLGPPGPPTWALPWTRLGPYAVPKPLAYSRPLTTNSGSAPDTYICILWKYIICCHINFEKGGYNRKLRVRENYAIPF